MTFASSSASPSADHPVVILGGGLTGISAALHLTCPYVVLEQSDRLGGLARSETIDGFTFDHTGHWLHLRDPGIKALVQKLAGDLMVEVARRARIFSQGALTLYPYQSNLYGLPPAVVYECLIGAFQAKLQQKTNATEPRNFEEYILHHFGAGIAKHFMIPYNTKLWGVSPRDITSAWCQRFVPIPDLEQIVAGAVGSAPPQLGYNIKFLYPKQGGIEGFTRRLVGAIPSDRIHLHARATKVDVARRIVTLDDGRSFPYRALITSVPLPQLIALIPDAPPPIRDASRALRATPADYHWVYVPEEKYPFYRVGIFSNAMPSMAPPGHAAYYVELAEHGPIRDQAALIDRVLDGLVEVQAIRAKNDVLFAHLRTIDPAYVVFDEAYETSLSTLHSYLGNHAVISRGRYGEWIYNAMEDSLMAGRAAAQAINQGNHS